MRTNRSKINITNLTVHVILIAFSVVFLYPLSLVFTTAFKTNTEVFLNPFGLPHHLKLDNFIEAWKIAKFGRLFVNSIFYTSVSLAVSIFICSLAAYAITRTRKRSQKVYYLFFISGIFVPFQLAIVPLFKIVHDLHLFNTYTGVILVYAASAIPFGIFLMTTFMQGLPKEIAEAGIIDGCSYFGLYSRIYFPLITTIIVTFAILQGLAVWNDFLIPYLLVTSDAKRSLPTGVYYFKSQFYTNWAYLMASIVMMITPCIVLYIFLQRFIIRGITGGAVKG